MRINGDLIFNELTIKLIRELRKHTKPIKSSNLADVLGCTSRTLRRHVELAKLFGYKIESFVGKESRLNKPGYLLNEEKLTKSEKEELYFQLPGHLYEKINRMINRV